MGVQWTPRAANDRAPQRESRIPSGGPKVKAHALCVGFCFFWCEGFEGRAVQSNSPVD